jgi:hypothetical protein
MSEWKTYQKPKIGKTIPEMKNGTAPIKAEKPAKPSQKVK